MPAYRASRCDLNTCTSLRAIIALRTRRISSSLLPENITPQITSIQPDSGLVKNPSGVTDLRLHLAGDRNADAPGRNPDAAWRHHETADRPHDHVRHPG